MDAHLGEEQRIAAWHQPRSATDNIAGSCDGCHGDFNALSGRTIFYADIMRAKQKREYLLD